MAQNVVLLLTNEVNTTEHVHLETAFVYATRYVVAEMRYLVELFVDCQKVAALTVCVCSATPRSAVNIIGSFSHCEACVRRQDLIWKMSIKL